MPELIVDSLDRVEESQRGFYVEAEGKFHFDPDKYAESRAQGLKTKNRELVTELAGLKAHKPLIDKFKDVDPEDFDSFLEWREAQANGGQQQQQQQGQQQNGDAVREAVERALTKERKKYDPQLKSLTAERDQLAAEVRAFKIWSPVGLAADEAKVLPDRKSALLKILQVDKRFDLNDGGKLVFRDADGDESDMTVGDAFKTAIRNEYPWAFAASSASGGGAQSSNGGGGQKVVTRRQFDAMSDTERMRFSKSGGEVVD